MKYIFIINPIAGNDNKAKILSRIKSAFRGSENEMIIEETQASGDAKHIAAKYAEKYGKDCVIVACGGDGTVHEIAGGLAFSETPMMLLPFGTGNDFAKKVYNTKKTDLEDVITRFGLFEGNPQYDVKAIDLMDYNGDIGINVMSFGLDTVVETIGRKMVEKHSWLGHNAYSLAIIPAVMKPIHYNISFEINCVNRETGEEYTVKEINRDYALFAICNASYYGGGFCPAPDSKLDDGILDYTLVNGLSLVKALPLIPKYSAGTANEETCKGFFKNGYLKSGRIWMEDGSNLLGNCDGENFEYSEINLTVREKALKLCVLKSE